MTKIKITLMSLILCLAFISCGQEENVAEKSIESASQNPPSASDAELKAKAENHQKQHPYGGWYCPDNFGFQPVNILELEQVPAIWDRLPTQEEARNGTSLIYVDSAKYPDAKVLEMELPRLAKVYMPFKEMSELIIVIQAVVIGEDTIVGYRFPSGGNGSAWMDQISFLNETEVSDLGSQPMVYKKNTIKGRKEDIWSYFSATSYAQELGTKFNEQLFLNPEWSADARSRLMIDQKNMMARGYISNHFGCIYMQIDFKTNGQHYTEKMLICDSQEEGYADIHFAAGPFLENHSGENLKWEQRMQEVISKSVE